MGTSLAVHDLAASGDGSLVLAGRFSESMAFVGTDVTLSTERYSENFLARYQTDGTLLWSVVPTRLC